MQVQPTHADYRQFDLKRRLIAHYAAPRRTAFRIRSRREHGAAKRRGGSETVEVEGRADITRFGVGSKRVVFDSLHLFVPSAVPLLPRAFVYKGPKRL